MRKIARSKIASSVKTQLDVVKAEDKISEIASEVINNLPEDSQMYKMASAYGQGAYDGEANGAEEAYTMGKIAMLSYTCDVLRKKAGEEAPEALMAALQEEIPEEEVQDDEIESEISDEATEEALEQILEEIGGEENIESEDEAEAIRQLAEEIGASVAAEERVAQSQPIE